MMLAYKGFEPGMVCRGYQFQSGTNVTAQANCKKNGFHCAANPLDCLIYYPDPQGSVYYLVDAGGDLDEDGIDTKISCTELTILRELELDRLILHGLAFMADHPRLKWSNVVQKDRAKATAGFAVARGVDPIVHGKIGDILALAKENVQGNQIVQIAMTRVDGKKILPNVWYDADWKKRGNVL